MGMMCAITGWLVEIAPLATQRTSPIRRVKAFQRRLNLTELSGIREFATSI
jgi:hypothetical protein